MNAGVKKEDQLHLTWGGHFRASMTPRIGKSSAIVNACASWLTLNLCALRPRTSATDTNSVR